MNLEDEAPKVQSMFIVGFELDQIETPRQRVPIDRQLEHGIRIWQSTRIQFEPTTVSRHDKDRPGVTRIRRLSQRQFELDRTACWKVGERETQTSMLRDSVGRYGRCRLIFRG